MENKLELFNFEGNKIRTVIQNGEPWWVLTDLCKILGLSNPSDAAKRLESDERSRFNLGRQGNALTVNEFGSYKLMFRSDKKGAKPFIHWVTHEVIPQIRKTGTYSVKSTAEKEIRSGELLTYEQRIEIGAVLAQCQAHNLYAVLDIFHPFLSETTLTCCNQLPKDPVISVGRSEIASKIDEVLKEWKNHDTKTE